MGWIGDINIDNVVIVAARFGGPIAVVRDRTKPGKIAPKSMGKPVIAIYSAAGNLISSFVVMIHVWICFKSFDKLITISLITCSLSVEQWSPHKTWLVC